MDKEYLEEVQSLYNTDKYTVTKIVTNKNTYTAKFPFSKTMKESGREIFSYSLNLKDWCSIRGIKMKDYLHLIGNKFINY